MNVNFELPPEAIDAIARRAAELVAAEHTASLSPYLNTAEAAEYLRCKAHRIHDLVHRGELRVLKDGSRNLYRREDLDAVLIPEERR